MMVNINGYKIAISGHRPKYWNYDKTKEEKIKNFLLNKTEQILETIEKKDLVYISGLALGVDILWAECAIENDIRLHGYVPCSDQDRLWKGKDRERYKNIAKKCELIHLIYNGTYNESKKNHIDCMKLRNDKMINDCDEALIIFNGNMKSGTGHFLRKINQENKIYEVVKLDSIINDRVNFVKKTRTVNAKIVSRNKAKFNFIEDGFMIFE